MSGLLVFLPLTARGQSDNYYDLKFELIDYSDSGYISLINNPEKDNPSGKTPYEYENPLRRFEITFFISLPFVFIVTFVSLHMYDVIKEKDPNVNVWRDYKPYLLSGTFGISSIIAFREAWICMETNRERRESEKQSLSLSERSFFLYVGKRF